MQGHCPRCLATLDPLKDVQKIDDYDIHFWRCPKCLNEYVE